MYLAPRLQESEMNNKFFCFIPPCFRTYCTFKTFAGKKHFELMKKRRILLPGLPKHLFTVFLTSICCFITSTLKSLAIGAI